MFLLYKGDIIIPGSVMFSTLNEEIPQFSLSFTSTGGPITSAIWTRDSEGIPADWMAATVLDNPITSQYIHTLIITGRTGGWYQCTVSNNKPSAQSISYYVQGNCIHEIFSIIKYNLCSTFQFQPHMMIKFYLFVTIIIC